MFLFEGLALQGQDLLLYHKFQGDSLLLRIKEGHVGDWIENLNKSHRLVLKGPGLPDVGLTQLIEKPLINEGAFNAPKDVESGNYAVFTFINLWLLPSEIRDTIYEPGEYTNAEIDTSRYLYLNHLFDTDFMLAKYGGYGAVFKKLRENQSYRLSMIDERTGLELQTWEIKTIPVTNKLPELKASWFNKAVKLSWESRQHMDDFWAYRVFISTNGLNFSELGEMPWMNIYDQYEMPLTTEIEIHQELDNNDENWYFRLHGLDHFGHLTEDYQQIQGKGYAGIGLAPLIQTLEQLPNNSTYVNWTLLDTFKSSVKYWDLYKAEAYEGPYLLDTAHLAPEVFGVHRTIPFRYTYYKLAAVDLMGDTVFSPPQMVWQLDTIPPAKPDNLTYSVDTSGSLFIQWSPNFEDDFLGYTLFWSNDSLGEYIAVNREYLREPEGRDTLYLRTGGDFMYYKVIAVDERNNRSSFSDILAVKKPDVVAPLPILFTNALSMEGKLAIQWENSISEDATDLILYRRKENANWEQVVSWNRRIEFPEIFIDSLVEALVPYEYTALVIDDDGLKSEPAKPIVGTALPDRSKFDVNDFKIFVRDEKWVQIVPYFNLSEVYEIFVYKRKAKEKKSNVLAILEPGIHMDANDTFDPKSEERHEYFLKVFFKDGSQSRYSAYKTVRQ